MKKFILVATLSLLVSGGSAALLGVSGAESAHGVLLQHLTEEVLVNNQFVLFSEVFAIQPSKGYPITFLKGGKVVTKNLALVTEWRIRDYNHLELLTDRAVSYDFTYDKNKDALVAKKSLTGGQVTLEIRLKK